MKFGHQLETPLGLGCLKPGIRYYYAGRSDENGVLLLWFHRSKSGAWRVGHIHLPEQILEKELTSPIRGIQPCARQLTLPPALSDLEGKNFNELNCWTFKRKQSHLEAVSTRLEKLFPLLDREQSILMSLNPLKAIGRVHKELGLSENVKRLQYWFFCYVLHGRNQWALKPVTHRNGTWSRGSESHADKKLGRRHADGSRRGFSSKKFQEQVIDSYLSRCGLGMSMRSIHGSALQADFGCRTFLDDDGCPHLYHPTNQPFPTYGQFRYVVVSRFGLRQVQETIYGHARMRQQAKVDQGSYSSQFANALESLEVDAYRVEERPLGFISGQPMPALVVARVLCGLTGKRLGIGFSLGGENQAAYKSAFASMSMPAELLAQLYGVPVEVFKGHEPVMTRSLLSDRGPAGQQSLLDDLERKFPVKSIAASYSGQSKPTVESANPKTTALQGEPSFVLSGHEVANLMRREVMRTFSENHQANIIDRLSPSALHDFHQFSYPATPHFYWKYLTDRLRTCAQNMDWRDAIRAFGTKTQFNIDRDGLEWKGVTFSSPYFREELHEKLVSRGVASVQGYTLSLVSRSVWVEINGLLEQLEPNLRIRGGAEDLLLPLSSLVDSARVRAEVASSTREAAQATQVRMRQLVKDTTGAEFDAGVRRLGSPKKSGMSNAEAKALRGPFPARRRA